MISNYTLKDHTRSKSKKVEAKLNALTYVLGYMNPERKLLMNCFLSPQFPYCPLTQMLHSKMFNNKQFRKKMFLRSLT